MRRLPELFVITVVDENRGATGGMSAIDVAPAVSDHETAGEVDPKLSRRAQQHAGARFAKLGCLASPRVETDFHPVDGKQFAHPGVHLLDDAPVERTAPDIRLIRRDYQEKAGVAQEGASLFHPREQFELLDTEGGVRPAIADNCPVDDTVAVEKNRPVPPVGGLASSQMAQT